MKTPLRLLGVVLVCTLGLTLAACSGTVKGKVTDESSGDHKLVISAPNHETFKAICWRPFLTRACCSRR